MATPCYCQMVVGPPGAGKTTYTDGMAQYMMAVGRAVAVINLDPANDSVPYVGCMRVDLKEVSE